MPKLFAYILFFSLFLLAACNEEKKDFMTPKQGGIVIDVNNDEYSLNGTVIGKSVANLISYHTEIARLNVLVFEERSDLEERVPSVKIIGVDDGESIVEIFFSAKYGVRCSPGLYSSFRRRMSVHAHFQILKCVVNFHTQR